MSDDLEEGTELQIDYGKVDRVAGAHVIQCAVQDVDTLDVILVAYVNDVALRRAVETRSAVFWSTSRNELWERASHPASRSSWWTCW